MFFFSQNKISELESINTLEYVRTFVIIMDFSSN